MCCLWLAGEGKGRGKRGGRESREMQGDEKRGDVDEARGGTQEGG